MYTEYSDSGKLDNFWCFMLLEAQELRQTKVGFGGGSTFVSRFDMIVIFGRRLLKLSVAELGLFIN